MKGSIASIRLTPIGPMRGIALALRTHVKWRARQVLDAR
jgi:hypothetical protein